MELAAWAEGVGGCVAGIRGEENDRVKELLNIPEDKELVTVMAFGYPTEEAASRTKLRKTPDGNRAQRAVRTELRDLTRSNCAADVASAQNPENKLRPPNLPR